MTAPSLCPPELGVRAIAHLDPEREITMATLYKQAIRVLAIVSLYLTCAPAWSQLCDGWTLRSTTGPSRRDHHAMTYDSARAVTVLFGGTMWSSCA